ncbi:hypothetical protein BTUL_0046g00220 [Botrytis tulipae]|uniref:Uncharacterized protein n=1 Tax=Botrytis tulipae TaxID=87230 RepID=A0A4Z1ERD4_9HELO|nr:hypothetical protein BTUL_0046g00220 [Botrytis tulipae]
MLNGAQNEATDSRIEVATADVTNSKDASPHDQDGDDADTSDEILRRFNAISRVH